MKPYFITESLEKRHLPSFEVEPIKYSFIPNMDIRNDDFYYPDMKNMEEICKSKRIIIIGHDLDEYGELIASILYYSFLRKGVSKDRLIRMPLTDNGIGYIGRFYNESEMLKLKDYFILETLFMKKFKTFGFKKILILKHLTELAGNKEHKVVNLNPNGTNSITHITKILINEE